jgi:hypothetical protein
MFAFVVTYAPHDHAPSAHAGGGGIFSTEPTQWFQTGIDIVVEAYNLAMTVAAESLELKEFILDGLAWNIVKQTVIAMTDSMVNWINSGFDGRPRFVDDLEGFLTEQADRAVGEFIESFEGAAFLCEPFTVSVKTAVEVSASRRLAEPPSCTLSDVVDNIEDFEDFIKGEPGSFTRNGGWNTWFGITTQPDIYTAFGQLSTMESERLAIEQTERTEQNTILGFGDGFFSQLNNCTPVDGEVRRSNCEIGTPGKLVQSALSSNLDSSREALIAADELDELMGAVGMTLLNAGTNSAFNEFMNVGTKAVNPPSTAPVDTYNTAVSGKPTQDSVENRVEAETADEQAELDQASEQAQQDQQAELQEFEANLYRELNEIEGAVNAIDPVDVNVNVDVDIP